MHYLALSWMILCCLGATHSSTFDRAAFLKALLASANQHWDGQLWSSDKKHRIEGSSAMVYSAMYARLSDSNAPMERAIVNYHSVNARYWNEKEGCYVDGHHFVLNAAQAWYLAATLCAASDRLPMDVRRDMETKLRSLCRYLASRSTSKSHDIHDFVAMNQDAFSAAAMALAAKYFNDSDIRRDAIARTEGVAGRVTGSLWVEGGIDGGYQSVGEPAFALAVDILWDDLPSSVKTVAAQMAMRPYAVRSLGLESDRSPSDLSAKAMASPSRLIALLHRVPNPLLAYTVEHMYRDNGSHRVSGWWWWDISAAICHWSYFHHVEQIDDIVADAPHLSWGTAARVTMQTDERGARQTGDYKAFISGADDITAMFGDLSRQNPHQLMTKRHREQPPGQFDPGGLRYVGSRNNLYVMASGTWSFPRFVVGDDVTDDRQPRLIQTATMPGYVGSQTWVEQEVSDRHAQKPYRVSMAWLTLGDTVIARLSGDLAARGNVRYEITTPTPLAGYQTPDDHLVTWTAPSVSLDHAPYQAHLLALDGQPVSSDSKAVPSFLANEKIRVWDLHGGSSSLKPPAELSRIIIPLKNAPRWVAIGGGQSPAPIQLKKIENGTLLTLTHDGELYYAFLVDAKAHPDKVRFQTDAGLVTLHHPVSRFMQVVLVRDHQLRGFHVKAQAFDLGDKTYFAAQASTDAAHVSMRYVDHHVYCKVDGRNVRMGDLPSEKMISLVDGTFIHPDQPVDHAWFYFTREAKP